MHGSSLFRVETGLGAIVGRSLNGVRQFRGVPYATAPVGSGRFEPPSAMRSWSGTLEANSDGPIAPQTPSRVYAAMGSIDAPQSEDCLTLTIWAPAEATAPCPVIVWFHGGGFMSGAGSLPWYDGEELARLSGAVVVNVNYRLGALGFLCVPGQVPGNLAVLDQEQALLWVRDHIAAFGGDPSRVTVMGQSGGGHNIAMLLTVPRTQGLFSRAILLSPPLGIGLHSPEEAMKSASVFLDALGINGRAVSDALKKVPLEQILQAQGKTAMAVSNMARGDLRPPFMPVHDGAFAIEEENLIEAAARAAAERGVEVLIGWTRDEANLFYGLEPAIAGLDAAGFDAAAERLAPGKADILAEAVRAARPEGSNGQLFMDLVRDITFRLPILDFADRLSREGGTAFVYRFDWASPEKRLGACHCIDLPFVFGTHENWKSAPILAGADPEECSALSDTMMRMVGDFARAGNPGIPRWDSNRRVTHIGVTSREAAA